jgi:hypothetical protein
MLNGLIDFREVRRAKAGGSSRSLGATSRQRSRQGAVDDARLQEVITQRDAYYQKWFASQQEQMSQHYANVVQQQMQVSLNDYPFSCILTKDNIEYLWILYQACFQSVGLNVQVPAIPMLPAPPFEPMAPWTFTLPPDAQVWELDVFYILYSINIIKNHLLYLGQSNNV